MKKGKEWLKSEILNLRNASNRVMVVAIGEVMDLIDQLGELNKPLVVPKELGEWLARQRLGDEGSFFIIIIELEDMWLGSSFEEFITDNKKQLIEVIIGNRDYEIEKEKLYKVSSNNQSAGFWFLSTTLDGKVNIGTNREFFEHDSKCLHITEKEIKDYDPRYLAFAMEVTE